MTARCGVVATYEWTVPGARSLEHRERVERALADARGVERQVSQSAAEEEQLPDLDTARVGSQARRDLDRARSVRNARIDRTASTDQRAGAEVKVRDEEVIADRAVERASHGGAPPGQTGLLDDQYLGAGSIGADDRQMERDSIRQAAAGVLGLDIHGVGGGAGARVDARWVVDEGVGWIPDAGEVSTRPDRGGEVDIVSADAEVGKRCARR